MKKATTPPPVVPNEKLAFQFIGVEDTGAGSHAHCPHCGTEGRYIYCWYEFGKPYAAMAGCYKLLTGKFKRDEITQFIESAYEKQGRGKTLNGWDKNVLRLHGYLAEGKYSEAWVMQKIRENIAEKNRYIAKMFRG